MGTGDFEALVQASSSSPSYSYYGNSSYPYYGNSSSYYYGDYYGGNYSYYGGYYGGYYGNDSYTYMPYYASNGTNATLLTCYTGLACGSTNLTMMSYVAGPGETCATIRMNCTSSSPANCIVPNCTEQASYMIPMRATDALLYEAMFSSAYSGASVSTW